MHFHLKLCTWCFDSSNILIKRCYCLRSIFRVATIVFDAILIKLCYHLRSIFRVATFVFDDYSILKQFPLYPIKPEWGAHLYLMKLKLLHLGLQKGRPLVMSFILSLQQGSKENGINSLKFFWKWKVAFVALILACCAFFISCQI